VDSGLGLGPGGSLVWGEVIAQWIAYWVLDPESLVWGEVIAQWIAYRTLDLRSLMQFPVPSSGKTQQ